MSLNQSRAGKSDAQSRRPGRSGNSAYQRSFSGVGGKGGGAATAPPSPGSSSVSLPTNRSFKKTGYNGQGVQSRVAPAGTHSEPIFANPASRPTQNGAHVQSPSHDAPVFGAVKPIDSSAPRSSQALPRAPSSQSASASGTLDSPTPATPQKGVSPRPYTLQFGSISPGFMNGMQIPARTSSAPPNLDEQKRDQVRHDSYKTAAPAPIPAAKQQQPRKDIDVVTQSNTADSHPATQAKRDVQVQIPVTGPVATTNQKSSVLPIPALPMPVSYQQQVPVQFSGPSGQVQSQAVTGSSLQIPMPLPIGNPAQVQSQVYVSNLQSHPLQSQGVMHQNQGIGFAPQMGHQLAPQLANISMGIAPQFSPHQPGKFGTARKTTVKITHPDTHEELRLDKRTESYMDAGSTGPKSHTNAPPHAQPLQSFSPAHPVNFYAPMHPNSYNTPSIFFQTPTSLPPSSTQVAPGSSALRYNYAVAQGGPTVSFMNPSTPNPLSVSRSGPLVHGTSEPLNFETSQVLNSSSSSSVQVTVKPAVVSFAEKVGGTASVVISAPTAKGESPKLPSKPVDSNLAQQPRESELGLESSVQPKSVVSEGSAPVVSNTEGKRREPIRRSDSLKDQQKKLGKKEARQYQQQHQADPTDSVGTLKSSSLRVPEDNGTATSLNVTQDSKNPENTKATSEVVGESTSVPGVLSPLEGTVSYAVVEPIKTDESKSIIPTVEVSEKIFKEATEAPSGSLPGSCDLSGKIINGVQIGEGGPCEPSKNSSLETDVSTSEAGASKLDDASSCLVDRELTIPESSEVELPKIVPQKGQTVGHKNTDFSSESSVRETDKRDIVESAGSSSDVDRTLDELVKSVTTSPDFSSVESAPSPPDAHQDKTCLTSSLDASNIADEKAESHQEVAVFEGPLLPVSCDKKSTNGGSISASAPGPKDRISVEQTRPKSTGGRKKKKKELLMKADAAGATSDLYNAYKGPEEKTIEPPPIRTGGLDCSSIDPKQLVPNDNAEKDLPASEEDGQSKGEVDDWEDAEISTPNLNSSENGEHGHGAKKHLDEIGATGKTKYSRDFLLSRSKQCTELPVSFKQSEVTEALMSGPVGRTGGAPRGDRRVGSIQDDDKWNKLPGSGRDSRVDVYGSGPGQGGNHGVLKFSRGQPPGQYGGGILCGPMQSLAPHVGMPRNSPDADRWQRQTGLQKGLFPSPQTSAQIIHKADRKYEVGKVSDQEEAKQRQLKAILNKLTPQNFEKLFEQVKAVNIDNAVTLKGVISQIFDKALMEPTFCEMYANFCLHLANELPDFSEDNEKINFKRLLLNKCQEEFERGEREEAEANRLEEEGEIKQSEEEREEKKTLARRRMLGNIRLIGELYKKRMLTERIMHECIKKLLGPDDQTPDEEDVEALCKLMSTIGEMIDHEKARVHINSYFNRMTVLSTNQKLSSRVRFMLKDSIDLRRNRWQQRRKVEGPKKIEEVHRDAAQERQLQTSRLARGPNIGSSARRGQQPMDYNTRGSSVLSSPGSQQMGGIRGFQNQSRGYGNQDVRMEERHTLESRTVSVPLPQRPMDDDSISLGPQGSLGRGMSISGQQQPIMSKVPLAELSSVSGDPRRMGPGSNSYGSPANHYNMREELMPYRFMGPPPAYDQSNFQERNLPFGNRDMRNVDRSFERSRPTSPAYDQLNSQERNLPHGNRDTRNVDRSFDRSRPTSPAIGCVQGPLVSGPIVPPETEIYEDRLREMSIAAIREFYSARNEEEVWLCIKDLKTPGFYSNMVTLWVTDSFERKNDIDRELLAKLLVNLNKSRDGILNQGQLVKGFESVLSTLEDAITDSPKAAEYLGRIFGKVILENVVPLGEIGKLIKEGGDEPGSLCQSGIASDVLVSVLEMIRQEKGESGLKEIRTGSRLNLEDFRPPDPVKSRRLNAFI